MLGCRWWWRIILGWPEDLGYCLYNNITITRTTKVIVDTKKSQKDILCSETWISEQFDKHQSNTPEYVFLGKFDYRQEKMFWKMILMKGRIDISIIRPIISSNKPEMEQTFLWLLSWTGLLLEWIRVMKTQAVFVFSFRNDMLSTQCS